MMAKNEKRKENPLMASRKKESYGSLVFRNFCRNKLAVLGLIIVIFFIICAVFAPWIAPYDPSEMHLKDAPNGIPAAPSEKYLLGTDNLGRDLLSRIIYGGRISLSVGFIATGISLLIGIPIGCIMGYYGGTIDFVISRLIDFLNCIPTFFILLIVNTMLKRSIFNVMAALGVLGWMGIARMIRGQVLSLKNEDFVQAAVALGYSPARIMFRHILPHALMPVIVSAAMAIGGAIVAESGLSFLGLGVQEPTASWGSMLSTAQEYLRSAPSMAIVTGALISITVISFNFIGDGLRGALTPKEIKR